MEQFIYYPGTDTYRCPNQSIMRSNVKTYQCKGLNRKGKWIPFKHYRTKECMGCPIKEQCTGIPRGRIIPRSIHQSAIDRNYNRVNSEPDYYRNGQQIKAHQFGIFKRQWGFTHVLTNGKENVMVETSIIFTTYNLMRSMSILGDEGILGRLKAHFSFFLGNLLSGDCMGAGIVDSISCNMTLQKA